VNYLVLTLLAGMFAPADATTLIEGGKAKCSIVVPDRASPTVQRAAGELASYLEKISGAKPAIVTESRAGSERRIDVGPTRQALARLPEGFLGDEERLLVRSVPEGVILCGGGDRGTLYAVYRFLERVGCRWLAPDCELVPRQPTVSVAALELDTRPAFAWRLFSGARAGNTAAERWGLKMGMNGFYPAASARQTGACLYYPEGCVGVHAYAQIMPPKEYFAAHPEWYPLVNGKRVPSLPHGGQLCVTAPGLADQFAANVKRFFDADPACQVVSISPNDDHGWCDCPACVALDRKLCGARMTKQGLNAARPFMGDRVFWFANEVAARVAKQYPDKKLLVLSYINYAEPPDTIRPLGNVVPFLCHYAPADYSRPINDPASEANRQFNDALRRWVKITPEVMLYSYVSKSQWLRLPRPVLANFSADVKYLYSLGVRRYYCQSSLSDWDLDGPLYYVIARLLWDPAADPGAIAAEWVRLMFGPAAAEIQGYYDAVVASARKTGKPFAGAPARELPGLFDHALLDEAMAALERAERAAVEEPFKGRVAKVARLFRYGYWMVMAIDAYEEYARTQEPKLLQEAVADGRKALGYWKEPKAAEMVQAWVQRADSIRFMGVVGQGFGKEEIKGGRKCWNADETGPGDRARGWATLEIPTPDPTKAVTLEIDVWGTSSLSSIVVNTKDGEWNRVPPKGKLSKKEQWDTLVFHIPARLLNPERKVQRVGFGGGDSQVWIAEVRVKGEQQASR
jgi:hypothetical protein